MRKLFASIALLSMTTVFAACNTETSEEVPTDDADTTVEDTMEPATTDDSSDVEMLEEDDSAAMEEETTDEAVTDDSAMVEVDVQ